MCLFTHFAAGALVGGATGNVGLAVIAGLVSHLPLDALPHYDFPDWRVELLGGLVALAVLLLFPFATWPAVAGGLAGMVPDLENLLQKLGRLSRRRFVFPSHTGLIPHGPEVGRGNLAWQAVLAVGCFLGLALISPAPASARPGEPVGGRAGDAPQAVIDMPEATLLSSETAATRLQVRFPVRQAPEDWRLVDPGRIEWTLKGTEPVDAEGNPLPIPPAHLVNVAVPTERAVGVRVVAFSWWREPARPVDPASLVEVSPPAIFRGVPLVTLAVNPETAGGGVLAAVTVEIQHAPAGRPAEFLRAAADRSGGSRTRLLVPANVLNQDLFRALRSGARAWWAARPTRADLSPHPFELTGNWVRLEVTETGIYRLTGNQLSWLGVSTGAVDPEKLRLFKGGGLPLDTDPEVPDSLQSDRIGLNEVAILVRDGGDGWDIGDDLVFYGFGTDAWRDRLDSDSLPLDHFEHPFASRGVYWLTWQGYGTPDPLPGEPRRVAAAPAPALGAPTVTEFQTRLHLETSGIDDAGTVQDNWLWDNAIYGTRTFSFQVPAAAAGRQAFFVIDTRSIVKRRFGIASYVNQAAGWLNNDSANATHITWTAGQQQDSLRVRVTGWSEDIHSGHNQITLQNNNQPDDDGVTLALALDSFDVLYWAPLTKGAGQLPVVHWGHQVAAPGEEVDLLVAIDDPAADPIHCWDVTRPDSALGLAGTQSGGPEHSLTLGLVRDPTQDRHLVVFNESDLRDVPDRDLHLVTSVRTTVPAAHYVVIHDPRFAAAGQNLALLRSTLLPGVDAYTEPVAVAVSEEEIYDNFSGGQKDPLALRNFLRWLARERPTGPEDPELLFVCFIGDASRDFRNYMGNDPGMQLYDFVPTTLRTRFPLNPHRVGYDTDPYSTDDGLVSFEAPSPTLPLDIPDLATGRLPVSSGSEALAAVERLTAYATAPESGLWRNRLVMVADDLMTPSGPESGGHMRQAEALVDNYIPVNLDVVKLYLADYESPPGTNNKPGARLEAKRLLNEGTTIFHYIGHGSNNVLADEQVMLIDDIYGLGNGQRRGVFLAFSCDVGIYDSPFTQSMAEVFVSQPNGGAIAAICASQVSWSSYNNALSDYFYENLFQGAATSDTIAVGDALLLAKVDMGLYHPSLPWLQNSQRYCLLGDPALLLPHPVTGLVFGAGNPDTLHAGILENVVVDLAGSGIAPGTGVTYDLRVEESRHLLSASNDHWTVYYWLPGSAIFRGSGPATQEPLRIPFKVPTGLNTGEEGRIRVIVETAAGSWSAAGLVPVVQSDIGEVEDETGPEITLSFANGDTVVPAGSLLHAAILDTSGIAIHGTYPRDRIRYAIFPRGGIPEIWIEVQDAFEFDPGSYTTGQVSVSLPADLADGPYVARMHARDMAPTLTNGNVGWDTLSFYVGDEAPSLHETTVTVFPNPTSGPCRLLIYLDNDFGAEAGPYRFRWSIFTLAGKRIVRLPRGESLECPGPGGYAIPWDGLDQQGDEIANGVYLFVLRGSWTGNEGRDFRYTGKLVIMK